MQLLNIYLYKVLIKMSLNTIPENLQDKIIYIAFKCVWLEDGESPEYSFLKAFNNSVDANIHLDNDNKKSNYLNEYNKIVKHTINYNNTTNVLKWNTTHNCWSDSGCFTTVNLEQIIKSF